MSDWQELERPWCRARVKELEAKVLDLEVDLADALARFDRERARANEAEHRLEEALWELGQREFE